MIRMLPLALTLLATPALADGGAPARTMPDPLPVVPFVMPTASTATLSNGVEVRLVENHEVPLWSLRVVVRAGPDADPNGKIGLRSVTLSMLDDGASGKSAAELASAQKRLGGSVGAGASRDVVWVGASGPTESLDGLIGLWSSILLHPEFPADRWAIVQQQRIEDLTAARQDPDAIAGRVVRHLLYGDAYTGRLESEAGYAALTRDDLVAWHAAHLVPDGAVILAGGDLTLETLVPLLESALGGWKPTGAAPATPVPAPVAFAGERLFVVDKPGAAQSVLRALLPVGDRSDDRWWDFFLANTAMGTFTGRVNMNLREDKGWIYGARCGLDDGAGPTIWSCATNVQADKTIPAVLEVRREVSEVLAARPITTEEVAYFASYRINAFAGQYETPDALLGQLQDLWTYHLPGDWLERWIPRLGAVTPDTANAALHAWLDPSRITWVIVGDAATITAQLAAAAPGTPLPAVVRLDGDGAELRTTP